MKHSIIYYLKRPVSVNWKVLKCALSPKYALRTAIYDRWNQIMDYPLNLEEPRTFCEKLQWLKVHDHNPRYHLLVDKYEVKKIVAGKIGEQYVAKLYAVYNKIEDIDFDALPNSFVLKCTHDSGGLVICPDKSKLDREEAIEKLRYSLSVPDYSKIGGQWAYGNIKPRIIAEEYIDTLSKPETVEYKITCIHGKVKMITICSGIAHAGEGEWFNDHFDREGNRLPFYIMHDDNVAVTAAGKDLPKKPILDELIRVCEILAKGIPQVRVDLYVHHGHVMFGEMSFYTWGGTMLYVPKEWDSIMGEWLDLSIPGYNYI